MDLDIDSLRNEFKRLRGAFLLAAFHADLSGAAKMEARLTEIEALVPGVSAWSACQKSDSDEQLRAIEAEYVRYSSWPQLAKS